MDNKLREIEEALSKATPGPWFTGKRGGQCHINHKHGNGDCVYDLVLRPSEDWVESTLPDHEIFEYDYEGAQIKRKEDAHLIANAPEWLRWQNDEIKRLIDELEQTIRMGQRNTLILAGERDKYRIEARQERELTANIVEERETLIIENERLISLLRQKEEENKRLQSLIRPPSLRD